MVPTVRVDEFPKTSGSQFHLLQKMRTPEYPTSRPKISDFTNLRFISPCRTQLWDENCLSGGCCFQCLSLTMLDVRWSCTKDFDMPTVTPLFPEAAPIAPPMIPAAPPSRWLLGNRRKAHPWTMLILVLAPASPRLTDALVHVVASSASVTTGSGAPPTTSPSLALWLARLTGPGKPVVGVLPVQYHAVRHRTPDATDRRGSGVGPRGGEGAHAVPVPAVRHA